VAKGLFVLPTPGDPNRDPSIVGAELYMEQQNTPSDVTFPLPANTWTVIGGGTGFKSKGGVCTVVMKEKVIKAICPGLTQDEPYTDSSWMGFLLGIPVADEFAAISYCADCSPPGDGTVTGDLSKRLKFKDCLFPQCFYMGGFVCP
jgi:hypothetical protein